MHTDDGSDWHLISSTPNPWGRVPITDGGRALDGRAKQYMAQLSAQYRRPDTPSRRHHFVPQAYLREWSSDGRRLWTWDTASGGVNRLGVSDLCVKENFYRAVGADGQAHNKVELLFGVVDTELRRVQNLFARVERSKLLDYDDLLGLGVSMAMQRMRTTQQRRIQLQLNHWLVAQNPQDFTPFEDATDPHRLAGVHTRLIFEAMWSAADVLTTRQIEIWHDDYARFLTCDAPVLVPFQGSRRPDLHSAPLIIWPVSPNRVVALSHEHRGDKAIFRKASGKMVGIVRESIERGRERMIFASDGQRARLAAGKVLRRRTQLRLRCSDRDPNGEMIAEPGCCVEQSEAFGAKPDVALCRRGLHQPAPTLATLA